MNPATQNIAEQLQGSDVHVWFGFPAKMQDAALLQAYSALLSAAERQREARFRLAPDRHSYLVTHAMLRTVLSRYVPLHPQAWRFVTNEHGRPEIANAVPPSAHMNFSVSHARGIVAVAVTRAEAVGVDTEDVREAAAPMDVASRYFASREVLALLALPADRQSDRFYEFWTLKEAYIKARGLGLSLPLEKISFQFQGERVLHFSVEPPLQDSPGFWRFWQFRPSPAHVLAICVRRERSVAQRLICRSCIPLVGEELVERLVARASA
jgi:4'-phosphopantetheinyl transferase